MYSISYKNGLILVRDNCQTPAFVYTKEIHLHQVILQQLDTNGFANGWVSEHGKLYKMPSYPTTKGMFLRKTSIPITKGYPLIFKDKKFSINIEGQWCEVRGGGHLIIKDKMVLLFSPIFK